VTFAFSREVNLLFYIQLANNNQVVFKMNNQFKS